MKVSTGGFWAAELYAGEGLDHIPHPATEAAAKKAQAAATSVRLTPKAAELI
jgi:hypothetical protein